jgi:hypothetical protein
MMVDARRLCSGATGRNGGQLVTFGATSYQHWRNAVGKDEALKILEFQRECCEAVYNVAHRDALEESEIRRVTRIMAFELSESLEEVRRSVDEYEKDNPDGKGQYKFVNGEEALQVSFLNARETIINNFSNTVSMALPGLCSSMQALSGRIGL